MNQGNPSRIHFGDLLRTLKSYPQLAPFQLSLFCAQKDSIEGMDSRRQLCTGIGNNSLCDSGCRSSQETAIQKALSANRPEVFRCPTGLLNFAVPFVEESGHPCCLLGSGIRENSLSLPQLASISNAHSTDGKGLLERLDNLPSASMEEVEKTAHEVHRLIPALLGKNLFSQTLERATGKLNVLTEVSAEFDRMGSVEELLALLGDTLVVMFDLGSLVTILVEEHGGGASVREALGLPEKGWGIDDKRIGDFLRRHPTSKPVSLGNTVPELLPGVGNRQAVGIPICSGGECFGLIALLDAELPEREQMFAELVVGRAALRLGTLRRERAHQREASFSSSLITMISSLSVVDNRQELFHKIVEMGAELLRASRGSLMLLDEAGHTLKIVAAKGMNQALAKSMRLSLGEAIAGRVAKNGFPLLVNDIEKDRRTASPNRPRFKTKSFISIPFKVKERTIGVLNLADKEGQQVFTQTDLDLLSTFAAHASLMIDRASTLERTSALEKMSVTDPLTGIYNRRLLEERMAEEMSRSSRLHSNFTLMLVDLDHFKIYNDLCGHIAGDNALKKSASLLKSSARDMDIVTRYGGEEFCIILPATSKKESIFVAERIRRAIENHPFHGEKELPLGRLTVSIGIASFPEDGDSSEALVHAADVALYQAKNEGRNRITLYDPSLKEFKQHSG